MKALLETHDCAKPVERLIVGLGFKLSPIRACAFLQNLRQRAKVEGFEERVGYKSKHFVNTVSGSNKIWICVTDGIVGNRIVEAAREITKLFNNVLAIENGLL